MNDMRGIGLDDVRRAYHALSGLLRFAALLTQGVALGWLIPPLQGLAMAPFKPRLKEHEFTG